MWNVQLGIDAFENYQVLNFGMAAILFSFNKECSEIGKKGILTSGISWLKKEFRRSKIEEEAISHSDRQNGYG